MPDIDIVGNGPSVQLWRNTGRYTVACNIPPHYLTYNALSIIDNQPVLWMKTNSWHPRVPVFCTPQVKTLAQRHNISGDWFDTYTKQHRHNSGHHAVEHFAGLSRVKTIHLWGMDSMFSDDLHSVQDHVIIRRQRPPLNRWWRPIWQELFERFSQVTFVIHTPQGEYEPYAQKNVRFAQDQQENSQLDYQNHSNTTQTIQ